jgi:hypothetical protein
MTCTTPGAEPVAQDDRLRLQRDQHTRIRHPYPWLSAIDIFHSFHAARMPFSNTRLAYHPTPPIMPQARSHSETPKPVPPIDPRTRIDQPRSSPKPDSWAGLSCESMAVTQPRNQPTNQVMTQQVLMWSLGIILWVTIAVGVQLPIAPIAQAAPLTCRPYHDREVCIDRIKRSAKNYWEYRVNLTIDGQKQPEDLLDCRHYQRIDRDGFIEPFSAHDVGRFVCRYFNHRDWR